MINTYEFKTKSDIINKKMPAIRGNNQYKSKTVIALDGGYSAVKGVGPERLFVFPSFAKKLEKELETVTAVKSLDIQYRNNKTGDIWAVGQVAFTLMNDTDIASTTDDSIYSRYRYNSEIFKVIMSTGLALGLMGTGDSEIFLQTGLPAGYAEGDKNRIIKALADDYDISIKLGMKPWINFKFSLPEDHIFVMAQPQGTLVGCAYGLDGNRTTQGLDILTSNSVILDVGFGTEDTISIKGGYKNETPQTYSDTAMRSVFEETIKEISKNYPIETKIFEFQNYLADGEVPVFDPETFNLDMIGFADILEKKNRELCEKSVRRLMQDYDNMKGYKYLIVTGGTGECRYEQVKDMLKGIKTLNIVPGNLNHPEIPMIYNNVLGYYEYRHAKLKKLVETEVTAS